MRDLTFNVDIKIIMLFLQRFCKIGVDNLVSCMTRELNTFERCITLIIVFGVVLDAWTP